MKRSYPRKPLIGVAGVIFDGNAVLLARRGKDPGKGSWNLPGGAVELGEPLHDALKREFREEASVDIEIGGLVGAFDSIVRDPGGLVRYHYVIVDYWGWIISGSPRPGSDVSEVQWIPSNEIEFFGIRDDLKKVIRNASEMRFARSR